MAAKRVSQEKNNLDFKLHIDNCCYNHHHHSADDTESQGKVGRRRWGGLEEKKMIETAITSAKQKEIHEKPLIFTFLLQCNGNRDRTLALQFQFAGVILEVLSRYSFNDQ